MSERNNSGRRGLGNLLLVAGVVLLIGVAAYFGWSQFQAAQMRTALAHAPTATAIPPSATPPPATPVATAIPPTAPPTATVTEMAAATETVTASPTRTPTAIPPTAAPPTHTPSPTPAPVQPVPPVRLVFPDLKMDAPVVPMGWEVVQTAAGPRSEWVIPKNEAGYHINSAQLGQDDNLVISGHNNIFGMVFRAISLAWDNDTRVQVDAVTDRSDVLNGRVITLFDAAGQSYQYTVTDFLRLKDTGVSEAQRVANARFMQPTGEAQLTIITCWPPTNNTHRLIVIAKPVQ